MLEKEEIIIAPLAKRITLFKQNPRELTGRKQALEIISEVWEVFVAFLCKEYINNNEKYNEKEE